MTKRKADDEIKPNSGLCEGESSSLSESASPVGKAVKIYRGKNWEKRYYEALEVSGNLYNIEDTVLLQPEEGERPFVAIIKEIKASNNGLVALTVQWFYRPEEAGEPCRHIDEPEVLYSLHLDEVPALSLLQKCAVHYLPPDIELPDALERPCYIVRRFYDCKKNKVWNLTDCLAHPSLSGSQRKEIAGLLNKTYSSLPLFQRWVLEAEQDSSSKGKGIVHCQSLKGLYTASSPKKLKRSKKSDSPVSDLRMNPSIESATPETAPSGTSVQISMEGKHIADPKNQATAGIVPFQCKVEQQLTSRSDLSFSKDMAAEKKPFAEKPEITTRSEGRAKEEASKSNISSRNDAVGKLKKAHNGTPKSSKAAVQSSLNSTDRNSMYLELEPDKLLQTGQPRKARNMNRQLELDTSSPFNCRKRGLEFHEEALKYTREAERQQDLYAGLYKPSLQAIQSEQPGGGRPTRLVSSGLMTKNSADTRRFVKSSSLSGSQRTTYYGFGTKLDQGDISSDVEAIQCKTQSMGISVTRKVAAVQTGKS